MKEWFTIRHKWNVVLRLGKQCTQNWPWNLSAIFNNAHRSEEREIEFAIKKIVLNPLLLGTAIFILKSNALKSEYVTKCTEHTGRGKPTSLRRFTFFPVLGHVLEEVFQRETDVRLIKESCQPGNSLKWRRSLFLVGRYETVPDQTPCLLRWEISFYNFGTFHVQNLNKGFVPFVYVWLN